MPVWWLWMNYMKILSPKHDGSKVWSYWGCKSTHNLEHASHISTSIATINLDDFHQILTNQHISNLKQINNALYRANDSSNT